MSPGPSGAVASARRRFALPAEPPLDRLRVLLLRVLWLNLAAVIPMLFFAHGSAWELRLAAGVVTVAIGAHCARAVRRGSLPLPTLVPEALALLGVGIVAGPVAVNGPLWCVLLFRSLYTPTRKAVIPAATTGLVLSGAFLLSPESHGQWADHDRARAARLLRARADHVEPGNELEAPGDRRRARARPQRRRRRPRLAGGHRQGRPGRGGGGAEDRSGLACEPVARGRALREPGGGGR